jgi:hypothetical protein
LEAAPQPEMDADPRHRILQLCRIYRETAHRYPTHYAIMFQRAIPEYVASPASQQQAKRSMQPLQHAVQHALDQGVLAAVSAEGLTMQLWAAAHGVVSLELARFLPPEVGEQLYGRTLRTLLQIL